MRIVCIGGGPAGLYFAILMKKADPAHHVTVYERNRPDDTFGWGVVFSDQTLDNMRDGDDVEPGAHQRQTSRTGTTSRSTSRATSSPRTATASAASRRSACSPSCRSARASSAWSWCSNARSPILRAFADADLIVAADGINSRIRAAYAEHFQPEIEWRRNKFVWLGTHRLFDAFTFIFVATEWGWFQAHAYRFNADDLDLHRRDARGDLARRRPRQGRHRRIRSISAGGCSRPGSRARSCSPTSRQLRLDWMFPRVSNKSWVKDNVVLMGDAAHSAHFSIGSGTKLALEDAIALARAIGRHQGESARRLRPTRPSGASRCCACNRPRATRPNGSRTSRAMPASRRASSPIRCSPAASASSHENLRTRDKTYLERVERWLGERATRPASRSGRVPPMFLPFRLRGMTLENRVVVSPMAMYSAKDGVPNDFHLVHLGARALGGAGLVFTEMTCVTPEGRISPGCCGLWNDAQARSLCPHRALRP